MEGPNRKDGGLKNQSPRLIESSRPVALLERFDTHHASSGRGVDESALPEIDPDMGIGAPRGIEEDKVSWRE